MSAPPEPTSEQCNRKAEVAPVQGERAFACWYPQMGGYSSKAIIVPQDQRDEDGEACFTAYVWHDGEFPFSDDDRSPRVLHHCAPSQFVRFGEDVLSMMEPRR